MSRAFGLLAWLAMGCAVDNASPRVYPLDDTLRLTDIQVKGTHNSYHIEPDPLVTAEWGYTHVPLAEQAAFQGVRQFELDAQWEEATGELAVLHVPVLDDQSTCPYLGECLFGLRLWSDQNPSALPLVVLIEPKTEFANGEALDVDLLEDTILSAWPRERIFTPDDLQGDAESLQAAVLERGWPTLGEVRQKLIVVLLDRDAGLDAYTEGGTTLAGRLMFANADLASPLGAFYLYDDPVNDGPAIAEAVADGFLVRTRADSGGAPEDGDRTQLDAALDGGAQLLSTDFPAPVDGQDYWLDLPGGTPARCNPLTAPPECTSEDLEEPLWVR
jgi:Phosphoinositide phospholipase C, Ca2+-dependent